MFLFSPLAATAQTAPASVAPATPAVGADFNNPQQRAALKAELAKLPPDQRAAKMAELREQLHAQRGEELAARKAKFQDKWAKASPAQRQKFCSNVAARCATKGADNEACSFAKSTCGGQ